MNNKNLESVIRRYVRLGSKNGRGWEECLHTKCDHGKKGNRAGFLFENQITAFHCFNCGVKTLYDPSIHSSIPAKMEQVLSDFNIPNEEYQQIVFNNLGKQSKNKRSSSSTTNNIDPEEIKIPTNFYLLSDATPDDKWAIIATDYLEGRGIDPNSYPFMLSSPAKHPSQTKWEGRVIIPIFKENKIVYYQGRALGNRKKKYESPTHPKDKVIYGFDRLFENLDKPLYILEGWFDAYAVNGIGILGNELSCAQIAWLTKSPRKKVYVPDRFGDGHHNALRALELGWCISTPDIGDCKDMSEAVHKYGKLYAIKTLNENICSGFEAHTKLRIFCKYEPKRSTSPQNKKSYKTKRI